MYASFSLFRPSKIYSGNLSVQVFTTAALFFLRGLLLKPPLPRGQSELLLNVYCVSVYLFFSPSLQKDGWRGTWLKASLRPGCLRLLQILLFGRTPCSNCLLWTVFRDVQLRLLGGSWMSQHSLIVVFVFLFWQTGRAVKKAGRWAGCWNH